MSTDTPYRLPSPDSLKRPEANACELASRAEIEENWQLISSILTEAGLDAAVTSSITGAQATRFEIRLGPGVPLEALADLQDAFAAKLSKGGPIRMLVPIPGRDRAGIEIPNRQRHFWTAGELFATKAWNETDAAIPLLLGRDLLNKTTVIDLADAPNLLIAGDASAGKNHLVQQFVLSLVFHFSPSELRLLLYDSRGLAFRPFAALPHLIVPPVSSAPSASVMLDWVVAEPRRRQQAMLSAGVRSIEDYNQKFPQAPLPRVVVFLSEISPLMREKRGERTTEALLRLATASPVGIHLIATTQFPYPENLSDDVRSCFPWRIAFKTLQPAVSELILDVEGAETLLDNGDLLFSSQEPLQRCQSGTLTVEECREVARFCTKQQAAAHDHALERSMEDAELAERNAAAAARAAQEAPMLPFAADEPPAPGHRLPEDGEPIALDALAAIVDGCAATPRAIAGALHVSTERAANLLDELTAHNYLGPQPANGGPRPVIAANLPPQLAGRGEPTRKTLEDLFQELARKIEANDPKSRTVAEFNAGVHAIGKKIVEEAAEVWMSAEYEKSERTMEEISQLVYHLVVLMLKKQLSLEDLYRNL